MKQLHVMLSDEVHAHLQEQVHHTGLSKSALIRSSILQLDIRPRPPAEMASILRELSGIGTNINQIARIANSNKSICQDSVEEAARLAQAAFNIVKDRL